MKLVKTITIITLSVMLILSLSLNIFILTMFEIKDADSFKQVLLCRELLESMSQLPNMNESVDTPQVEMPNTELEIPNATAPTDAEVIYNKDGVKIMFVAQELGLMGPSLKFYVENNTDRALDVCLTNIYIDGFKAEYCGMYCDELGAGKKSYESLTLWESDYEDFSEFPSVIEFVVKIQDSESWNTIVETDTMYLCLD